MRVYIPAFQRVQSGDSRYYLHVFPKNTVTARAPGLEATVNGGSLKEGGKGGKHGPALLFHGLRMRQKAVAPSQRRKLPEIVCWTVIIRGSPGATGLGTGSYRYLRWREGVYEGRPAVSPTF